jgi:hypothetical protein
VSAHVASHPRLNQGFMQRKVHHKKLRDVCILSTLCLAAALAAHGAFRAEKMAFVLDANMTNREACIRGAR